MEILCAEPLDGRIAHWGEGPFWHEGILWYVDIEGHAVIRRDWETGLEIELALDERVGTVVPRLSGGLVIAGDSGIRFLDPDTLKTEPIADPEASLRGNTRFNDGKCDPAGRFWAGTISLRRQPEGALYRLDATLTLERQLDGITNSNGICWNQAGDTMYYIDTPTRKVIAYDYEMESGAITNPRPVVDTAALGIEGSPDGMVMDERGRLWVAICHAGAVYCFDPTNGGNPVARVDVASVETTACAFCGANRDELVITTGIPGSGSAAGHDGQLHLVRPGVRGLPMPCFAG